MQSGPTISIVTAVYNRARTVGDSIASVRAQSWPHVEHIVIDGGSTDGTLDILQALRPPPAVLVSEPDRGIYDALNKGFGHARGDVVGLLHSDDLFADARVLERVAGAFGNSGVDVVYGDLDYVAAGDPARVIRRWRSGEFSPRKLAWGWMPPHPTLYMRRELFASLGGFDTSFRIAADYELLLRLFSRPGLRVVHIPEVLVKMRIGGASNRLSHLVRKSREDYRALRRNDVGGVGALAWKNLSKLSQFF